MTVAPPARLYLAGPMRGLPLFNFPAFTEAAADLRERGFVVWSPAENDVEEDNFDPAKDIPLSLREYMARDLPAVLSSDAIALLPNWRDSQGATLEATVARECGIPLLAYPDLAPAEVARHPNSERFHDWLRSLGALHDRKQADYGRGDDPFANVRGSEEWAVPGWVGAMIRLTDKVRRLETLAQRGSLLNEDPQDSFDDIAVYAGIARVLYEEAKGA